MTKQHYMIFLRMLAVCVSVSLWFVSINFSVDGFNFQVANMAWAGWVLGLSITAIQLIWNKQGLTGNMTLGLVGVAAYLYGIATNVIGVLAAQGGTGSMADNPLRLVFALLLGVFLEITPEPMLVWGLLNASDMGDFLSNIFGMAGYTKAEPSFTGPADKAHHPQASRHQYPQNSPASRPKSVQIQKPTSSAQSQRR